METTIMGYIGFRVQGLFVQVVGARKARASDARGFGARVLAQGVGLKLATEPCGPPCNVWDLAGSLVEICLFLCYQRPV